MGSKTKHKSDNYMLIQLFTSVNAVLGIETLVFSDLNGTDSRHSDVGSALTL